MPRGQKTNQLSFLVKSQGCSGEGGGGGVRLGGVGPLVLSMNHFSILLPPATVAAGR